MRPKVGALWVITLLVTLAAPLSARAEVARFALVVGNNQPPTGAAASLRYADDDAVAMHRLLTQAGVESRLLVRLDRDSRRLYGSGEATGEECVILGPEGCRLQSCVPLAASSASSRPSRVVT